jgi:hypothetical protein
VAIIRPKHRLIKALTSEVPPSATTVVSANSSTAKYSGESNFKPNAAKWGASRTARNTEMMPPTSAANIVHPSALAGSPFFAMA